MLTYVYEGSSFLRFTYILVARFQRLTDVCGA